MMKTAISLSVCAFLTVSCTVASADLVFGGDALMQFEALHAEFNEGFNDFESVNAGFNLNPNANPFGDGVNFASVIATNGSPFGPEHVEVSNRYVPSVFGNTIVGSPGGSDDARVGYEITFDTAQRRAGLLRLWNTSITTSFYNAAGELLGTHQNSVNQEFVGWIADSNDESTWVSRILMDSASPFSSRQVGHSDDLYWGTVPAPTTTAGLLLGLGCISRRRR
jgi:hypothetical protein